MADNYNTPHRDEILEPILDPNGQPQVVYNIKKIADGTTLYENVCLELVNQIIQSGTWATANVINDIIAKNNAQTELIATLMLLAELKDDIRSTGNDNLEVFGISNAASIGILNNHSDFGVLKNSVSAGANQITAINASGYRFVEELSGYAQLPKTTIPTLVRYDFDNITLFWKKGDKVIHRIVNETGDYNAFGFETYINSGRNFIPDWEHDFVACTDYGSYSTSGTYTYRMSTGALLGNYSGNSRIGNFGFYNDNDQCIYAYPDNQTGVVLKTNPITNSTTKLTTTVVTGSHNLDQYPYKYQKMVKTKGLQYFVTYINTQPYLYIGDETFLNFVQFPIPENVKEFANNATAYVVVGASGKLYRYKTKTGGKLDTTDTGIEVDLGDAIISDVYQKNGILFACGANQYFAYSSDGLTWNKIETSSDLYKNYDYLYMFAANERINVMANSGSTYVILSFESFNPENFKNKRYVLDNEKVTITDVTLSGDNIILKLQNNLLQTHTAGTFLLRTTDSTIQPNSTQTVTVEIDNLYSHNAAVAIPTFTSLENVTVTAEICQRDDETQVEEWVPFPLINSLDVRGWKKNTYFKVFEQAKQITAIAFTVQNNNDTAVELHQLNVGLSDEIYELSVE